MMNLNNDSKLYVLWKAAYGTFEGRNVFIQHTPSFQSLGKANDSILIYTTYEDMMELIIDLGREKYLKSFLYGYDPLDYIKSFSVDTIAEIWDACNLLLDFNINEVKRLLWSEEEERINWLLNLPSIRMKGINVIGGSTWKKE